jgi:hypothetical protein
MNNQNANPEVRHNNNPNNVEQVNIGWSNSDSDNSSWVHSIISLFWSCVTIYAIYLSFKCNKGFSFIGFLGALILSPIYIAYKYATSWNKCF